MLIFYLFFDILYSLNCVTTTKDATAIAGGFSESYIKIWSLKGEKLKSLRNTINPAHVNDCMLARETHLMLSKKKEANICHF